MEKFLKSLIFLQKTIMKDYDRNLYTRHKSNEERYCKQTNKIGKRKLYLLYTSYEDCIRKKLDTAATKKGTCQNLLSAASFRT